MSETGVLFLTGTIISDLEGNVEGKWDIKTQYSFAEKELPWVFQVL
jgi:hypothetical protein